MDDGLERVWSSGINATDQVGFLLMGSAFVKRRSYVFFFYVCTLHVDQ